MNLANWNSNPGAEPAAMLLAAQAFGGSLPADYAQFLAGHNGGEGFIGKTYVVLWPADQLADFNDDFQVAKTAPGLIMFGTDGGEEGFAFDTRKPGPPVVMIAITGMDPARAKPVGGNFTEFMDRLAADETEVPDN